MRVESCGPLFAEPREGDIYFQPHRLSEPIAIINPKNSFEVDFSLPQATSVAPVSNLHKRSISFENEGRPHPVGFFLSEEEWSLIKQPRLGLESGNDFKMNSLPKSLTPLALASASGEFDNFNNNRKISEWGLRKCESLSATPSLTFLKENELNNNNETPATSGEGFSSSKVCLKVDEGLKEEDEKENWTENPTGELQNNDVSSSSDKTRGESPPLSNNVDTTDSISTTSAGRDGESTSKTSSNFCYGSGGVVIGPRFGLSCVDTIDSHPLPISSASRGNNHTPTHLHYHHHCQQQQYFSGAETQANPLNLNPPVRSDGAALSKFLSKFTDEVAAIWGSGGGNQSSQSQCIPPYNMNASTSSEDQSSSCSTPVNNPWSTPPAYANDDTNASRHYDLGAMQIQLEQQQQVADSQERAERFYRRQYERDLLHQNELQLGVLTDLKQPSISIPLSDMCDDFSTFADDLMPPPQGPGKYTIMHAMKQHFGCAPPPSSGEYHILRRSDVDTSPEERERSFQSLNHLEGKSTFKRFVPDPAYKQMRREMQSVNNMNTQMRNIAKKTAEQDLKSMQDMISGLDLECDEELEIVNASNNNKGAVEEELLNSWKTHFTTIEAIERSHYHGSPSTKLHPHQINPNLPEYKLFDGREADYSIFQYPAKTLFPIRYKLRQENEKGVQTQTEDFLHSEASSVYNQFGLAQVPVLDWDSFGSQHEYQFNLASGARTPLEQQRNFFDYDNSLEIHTTDWFTADGNGLGSGSIEFDYGGGGGEASGGLELEFPHQQEYCCDSGIGIDNSSQIGFYDDVYPDYSDGDYIGGGVEYMGGGGQTVFDQQTHGTTAVGSYMTNEDDVDYGQFQGFATYSSWSNSSASGKASKSNRRRAKVKPCKYFLLDGSCRRGRECKFSHDLTTCRYWAEGSCLKGDSCPYLHYFVESRQDLVGHGEFKRIGKRYHLESENDFPALGSTKGNTTLSSREMSVGFPQMFEGEDSVSTENLLMLADPVGSMSLYDGIGGAVGGFLPSDNRNLQPPPLQQFSYDHQDFKDFVFPTRPSGAHDQGQFQPGSGQNQIGQQDQYQQLQFPELSSSKTKRGRAGNTKVNDNGQWIKGNGSSGHLNNNWISSSMISVKEKRKKKKQQQH